MKGISSSMLYVKEVTADALLEEEVLVNDLVEDPWKYLLLLLR